MMLAASKEIQSLVNIIFGNLTPHFYKSDYTTTQNIKINNHLPRHLP